MHLSTLIIRHLSFKKVLSKSKSYFKEYLSLNLMSNYCTFFQNLFHIILIIKFLELIYCFILQ